MSRGTKASRWCYQKWLRVCGESYLRTTQKVSRAHIDCDEVLKSGLVVGLTVMESGAPQFGLPESPSKSGTSRGSQTPRLLTPRNTDIAEGHPTFEWEAVPNASGYRLSLTILDGEDWQAETTETRLSYPAELPPLPAGSTVFVGLATLERPTDVDQSLIDLLDQEPLTELQAQETAIHDLNVDEGAKAYLLAQLYGQQGMKSAAITQLEQITANEENISANLWQQLGELYFELERHKHAEKAYQKALSAAEANSDQQAQAKATIGLALTVHAFNESEQALAYHDQAEALAREVGAEELVEKVRVLREQMGG